MGHKTVHFEQINLRLNKLIHYSILRQNLTVPVIEQGQSSIAIKKGIFVINQNLIR